MLVVFLVGDWGSGPQVPKERLWEWGDGGETPAHRLFPHLPSAGDRLELGRGVLCSSFLRNS